MDLIRSDRLGDGGVVARDRRASREGVFLARAAAFSVAPGSWAKAQRGLKAPLHLASETVAEERPPPLLRLAQPLATTLLARTHRLATDVALRMCQLTMNFALSS